MTECLPDLPRYIRQRDNGWQGADHPDGPWRPIPAPQSGLSWMRPAATEESSVLPQPTILSPAAQAVLDAFRPTSHHRLALAAALRAAVEQAVPEPPDCGTPANDYVRGSEDRQRMTRFWLLAIVAELENANA